MGAALFYGAGFLIMTLRVKEGVYPPPVHEKIVSVREKVRVYVKECYSHPHYLWFNLRNAFFCLSFSSDMFIVFYLTKSLHIGLDDIGHIGANATLVLLVLIYPSGALADRFKPLPVSFATMLLGLPVGLVCFLFITSRPSFLLLGFAGAVLKGMVANLDLPLYASIPPQERYGQFGSANQLFICLFSIPGSFLTGVLMDWLTQNGTRPEMYRYCYLWGFVMFGISTFFMYLLYRSWRAHGGPHHYVPPRV